MARFQVQHKNNSNTFTDIIEANSHIDIINLFQDLVNSEITEIREIIYTNPTYPKDDGLYFKTVSALLVDDKSTMYSLKLPKVKKTLSKETLISLIKTHIKINGKIPIISKINNFF
jgi:hypothetical protein